MNRSQVIDTLFWLTDRSGYPGGVTPIGRRVTMSNEQRRSRDVVGVVAGVRQTALDRAMGGVISGSAAAWLAAPALGGMLYGIAPRDPSTLALAAAVLLTAAALAAYIPARRILRLDVINALRVESGVGSVT